MTRFPQTEPEIAALALVVSQGLREAAEDFPAPPVAADELQSRLDRYNTALAATVAAENSIREQHAEKDEALEDVVDGVKANLRYAEVAVRDKPEELSRLGWGPRRNNSALQPPGEVRDIAIVAEGDSWTILRWKPPVDGGAPAFYRIQRRQEGAAWEDAGTATTTEQLMSNQPRGVELAYRVLAVNEAGDWTAQRDRDAGVVTGVRSPRARSGDYGGTHSAVVGRGTQQHGRDLSVSGSIPGARSTR